MSRANSPAFSVQVGAFGPEALSVSGISGTEGVSRLYDFRVDFFTKDGEPLTVADLVGKDALLTLSVRDGSPRYVHGVVREVESPGLKTGRRRYRAHVVPKLWRLSQVHKSRIFQNKSVPDILKAVLGEGGIEVRLALSGSYAAREYCVQYRESDFAFVSRLMEWEGIFYFFEHTDSGHTLVLGDKPSAHAPLTQGQTLPLRPRLGKEAVDGEFVYALEVVHRLRPGAVHLKDFDFEKPALDISGKGKASEGVAALEIYDYPAGYVAPGVGKAAAGVRAEAAGMGGRTLTGEAIAPRLTPGFLLELDAPEDGTFAGEYLITEVVHSGMQPDVSGGSESLQGLYRNQFHLLPKAVPFRPRRLTPLPQIAGPQTATVTGPAGEEIHTDSHGRIKVQFHWDREGKKDEKSSCWVRVGQPWGGPAWGDVWLPRIGQEVIIRFLEGDPDRPLVAGAVYNGTNTVPYGLPGEKTKSTRKSASSLGSNGFNEVRIEDAAGEEEVFTHAQKDEELITENDKDQQVRGYEDLLVKKDRKRTVEGNQELRVGGEDVGVVEGNQTLLVQGNRSTKTTESHSERVEGNQVMTVGGNLTVLVTKASSEDVFAAKATTIGGAYSVNVALAYNEATGAARMIQIGAAHTEHVLGVRQETVVKDKTVDVGMGFDIRTKGQLTLNIGKDWSEEMGKTSTLWVKEPMNGVAKKFELKADTFNLLVGGNLILKMEKSGDVTFAVKTLTLDGKDVKVKAGKKVKMEAAGSLKSDKRDEKTLEHLKDPDPLKVEFTLKDTDGKPIKDQPFELHMPDGTVKKGRIDGSGKGVVEKVPPGDYRVVFPEMTGRVNKGA
ncbi:type VI secretion system tip protein VgrG [Pyxidicoccus parkwayensis]|uniref:Type VI secretion system tip protein VgrG n=1 Tax=Pyxidicoccus parkwayensis TaxID=2813578 RepID=A0ABX7P2K1_9BACT|nr:type VI secretion system tip protein VgrG [Pyxidicoccus parkwaysis]QSQ24083.1 type VI secretion system tip protein VgrG [Pyxidicoccus parkwaysis]